MAEKHETKDTKHAKDLGPHPYNTPLPPEEPHEWTPEQLATPPACEPWPIEMNPTETKKTQRERERA